MRDRVLAEVTRPEPFITVNDLKAHLRLDGTDEDAYLAGLCAVASAFLDGRDGKLGRALAVQTWELRLGGMWYSGLRNDTAPIWAPWWQWHGTALGWAIRVPLPPLREIASVKYRDASGALQTVPEGNYEAVPRDAEPALLTFRDWSWPSLYGSPDAIQVRFTAGYDADKVPVQARHAALLQAARFYEQRENPPADLTGAAWALVQSLRVLE